MRGKYKVITLCGSARFQKEFMREQKRLSLEGNIVISLGFFDSPENKETWNNMNENTRQEKMAMLKDMHKRKIDMADEIFVINPNGYIGESTKSEIAYAQQNHKPVRYLEEPK